MEGNEQLPIGTLPMSMDTEKKDAVNKMGRINSGDSPVGLYTCIAKVLYTSGVASIFPAQRVHR